VTTEPEFLPAPDDYSCARHPGVESLWSCPRCAVRLCDDCVNHRQVGARKIQFCKQCGALCGAILPATPESAADLKSFFQRVPAALQYAFRRDGVVLLVGGALFMLLVDILSRAPLVGLLVSFFGSGYLCAYLLKVIQHSALGNDSLPNWPDFTSITDDILPPLKLVLFPCILCAAPALLWVYFGPAEWRWVAWAFAVCGVVYLPMCLLGAALYDSAGAADPRFVVPSILKVPGPYLITVLGMLIGVGAQVVISQFLSGLGWPGSLLGGFIGLYCILTAMHLLGLLYFTHRDLLNWE
jgi:hypothetical protein